MGNAICKNTKNLDFKKIVDYCMCKKNKIVEKKTLTDHEIEEFIEITGLEKEEIESWFAGFIVCTGFLINLISNCSH